MKAHADERYVQLAASGNDRTTNISLVRTITEVLQWQNWKYCVGRTSIDKQSENDPIALWANDGGIEAEEVAEALQWINLNGMTNHSRKARSGSGEPVCSIAKERPLR